MTSSPRAAYIAAFKRSPVEQGRVNDANGKRAEATVADLLRGCALAGLGRVCKVERAKVPGTHAKRAPEACDFLGYAAARNGLPIVPIALEVKHCTTDVLELRRFRPSQIEQLDAALRDGALALVCVVTDLRLYLVPWRMLRGLFGGAKSVRVAWLAQWWVRGPLLACPWLRESNATEAQRPRGAEGS